MKKRGSLMVCILLICFVSTQGTVFASGGVTDKTEKMIDFYLADSDMSQENEEEIPDLSKEETTLYLDYFNKGLELYDQTEYKKALGHFEAASNLNPLIPEIYLYKGKTLYILGEYESALENFNRAIQLNPVYVNAYINKGYILNRLSREQEAARALQEAIAIMDKAGPGNYNYGYLSFALIELGEPEEALKYLNILIQLNPGDDAAYNNKGWALNNLGRYEEAIEALTRAIELDPVDDITLVNMGNALLGLDKHEEALEYYNKTLTLNPKNTHGYYGRGNVNYGLERYEEAKKDFQRYIELVPSDMDGYNSLIRVYSVQEDYLGIIEVCDQILSRDAEYNYAYYQKANALYNLGKTEEALQVYDQMMTVFPKEDVYYDKADALYYWGMYQEALKIFDEMLGEFPEEKVLWLKADSLYYWEEYEEALKTYDTIIAKNPQDMEAYYQKAYIYEILGEDQKALETYDTIIKFNWIETDAYYYTGKLLEQQEKYQQALQMYQKAVGLEPEYVDGYYSRAKIYAILKKNDSAISELRTMNTYDQSYMGWVIRDETFNELKKLQEFKQLISPEYDYFQDNKYINEYFDMTLQIPEDWNILSEDEKESLMLQSMNILGLGDNNGFSNEFEKEIRNVYHMMLVTTKYPIYFDKENPRMIVQAIKADPQSKIQSGEAYLSKVTKPQLDTLGSDIVEVIKEIHPITVDGETFFGLQYKFNLFGMETTQYNIVKIVNGYYLNFILSSRSQLEQDELMKIFQSIELQ